MSDPNPPKTATRATKNVLRVLVAIAVVTLFLPLLFVLKIAITGSEHTVAGQVTADQQAKAEKAMGLKFPAETKFLLFHRELDSALYVKAEMPSKAVTELIDEPVLKSAKWSTAAGMGALSIDPAWTPTTAHHFRATTVNRPNSEYLDIEIVDDQNEPKIVYLAWSKF